MDGYIIVKLIDFMYEYLRKRNIYAVRNIPEYVLVFDGGAIFAVADKTKCYYVYTYKNIICVTSSMKSAKRYFAGEEEALIYRLCITEKGVYYLKDKS